MSERKSGVKDILGLEHIYLNAARKDAVDQTWKRKEGKLILRRSSIWGLYVLLILLCEKSKLKNY
jgi:hypothetical protein